MLMAQAAQGKAAKDVSELPVKAKAAMLEQAAASRNQQMPAPSPGGPLVKTIQSLAPSSVFGTNVLASQLQLRVSILRLRP